ncbi:MAG TPA: hypothetical protein VM238_04615 [Phycisphaerae bacterium]|nr:hypothetical protein [Phycisphaerae bacterium]
MAKRKDLERVLQTLFRQETYWLRRAAGMTPKGAAPSLTKAKRKRHIERLQKIALDMHVRKVARAEFAAHVEQKKTWHVTKSKGYGRGQKKKSFAVWFNNNVRYKNCVYVFWAGKRCRYVGRTLRGKGRPQAHFDKHWFSGVTRIDIHSVKRPSVVPKLECLAMHRYNPSYTKYKAARKKWTKRCPICEMLKALRVEAMRAFPLRRKTKPG